MPTKSVIQALIKRKQALLSLENITLDNYHYAIKQELKEEIVALTDLMSEENWIDLFKNRCAMRAVNFIAIPCRPCNELYAEIATLVFKPKTLGELLKILLPKSICISFDLLSKPGAVPAQLKLEEKSPEALLKEPLILDRLLDPLKNLIFSDNLLIDARAIAGFYFSLHQAYYRLLKKAYPNLAKALYQHNSALRSLRNNILMVNGAGQFPLEVLFDLIAALKLGGQTMTGRPDASLGAQLALAEFKGYLESLPVGLREELLALSGTSGQTIRYVIEKLNQGDCVEIAAKNLQAIIGNERNRAVLTKRPTFSSEGLIALGIASDRTLPTASGDTMRHFPPVFLKKAFSQVRARDVRELLSMLIDFPPELYVQLLKNVQLPSGRFLVPLFDAMRGSFLSKERQNAVNKALVIARDRFGGAFVIDTVFAKIDRFDLLIALLQILPDTDRLAVLNKKDEGGLVILHREANNLESINIILGLLPKEEYLDAVFQIAAFYAKTDKFDLLIALLKILPEADQLAVVKKKSRSGNSLLYYAANNFESFKTIWVLFSKEERLAVLKKKIKHDETLLHYAAHDPELIKIILELFPKENQSGAISEIAAFYAEINKVDLFIEFLKILPRDECLTIVKKTNILYHVANNPGFIKIILELLRTQEERLAVMEQQDKQGNTMLHYAVANFSQSIETILELLPKEKQLALVKQTNKAGMTILDCVPHNRPQSIKTILELWPKEERFAVLKKEGKDGESILHYAAKQPDFIEIILELLPSSNRLDAMKAGQPSSNPLEMDRNLWEMIHYMLHHEEFFKKNILQELPEDDLSYLLMLQNSGTDTSRNMFEYVANNHPEYIKDILDRLPTEEDRLAALKSKQRYRSVLDLATHNISLQMSILQSFSGVYRRDLLKTKEMSLFAKLSPLGLIEHYPTDGRNEPLRAFIEEQLHLFPTVNSTLNRLVALNARDILFRQHQVVISFFIDTEFKQQYGIRELEADFRRKISKYQKRSVWGAIQRNLTSKEKYELLLQIIERAGGEGLNISIDVLKAHFTKVLAITPSSAEALPSSEATGDAGDQTQYRPLLSQSQAAAAAPEEFQSAAADHALRPSLQSIL